MLCYSDILNKYALATYVCTVLGCLLACMYIMLTWKIKGFQDDVCVCYEVASTPPYV